MRTRADTRGLTPYRRGDVDPCLRVPPVTAAASGIFYLGRTGQTMFSNASRARAVGPGVRPSPDPGTARGLAPGRGDGAGGLGVPDPARPSRRRAHAPGTTAAGGRAGAGPHAGGDRAGDAAPPGPHAGAPPGGRERAGRGTAPARAHPGRGAPHVGHGGPRCVAGAARWGCERPGARAGAGAARAAGVADQGPAPAVPRAPAAGGGGA